MFYIFNFRNYQKLKLLLCFLACWLWYTPVYTVYRLWSGSRNKVISRIDQCCPIRTSIEFRNDDGTFVQSFAHGKCIKKITTINELFRPDSVVCASSASKMEYSFSYFSPFRSNNTLCWHTTQRGVRLKRENKKCFGKKWRQTAQQMPKEWMHSPCGTLRTNGKIRKINLDVDDNWLTFIVFSRSAARMDVRSIFGPIYSFHDICVEDNARAHTK